ncbi:dihydrodipicolinate synthase family protein [Kosakonia sp. BYX6]|uniref:Dihydrodipicolinate synthase family protein n=1 Tax=Kosakonia calanthes TaxID=3139408 RepID=A0ABZ3B023_9ENTR
MQNALYAGVNAAAVTSYNADFTLNYDKTIAHCHFLLNNGCDSLAVLGTTSETHSLSADERETLLEQLVNSGISPGKMLPGTSACDLPTTIRLTRHAAKLGSPGVLLLPPFYYKAPSQEGLFAFYSAVAEAVGGDVKLYFYHFPQQSTIPITLDLIDRLRTRHPGVFQGIKDSSGNFANTVAYIERFSTEGFEVYSGADATFAQVMQAGAAGCITATTNIASSLTAFIYRNYDNADGLAAQEQLSRLRQVVGMADTIPAVKTLLAYKTQDASWETMRPPLCALSSDIRSRLLAAYGSVIGQ